MATGKTIALTRWTFLGKVMSAFEYAVKVGHRFSSKVQVSFNFMVYKVIKNYSVFLLSFNDFLKIMICLELFCCEVMELDAMIVVF